MKRVPRRGAALNNAARDEEGDRAAVTVSLLQTAPLRARSARGHLTRGVI